MAQVAVLEQPRHRKEFFYMSLIKNGADIGVINSTFIPDVAAGPCAVE